jgi:hypothetical protein
MSSIPTATSKFEATSLKRSTTLFPTGTLTFFGFTSPNGADITGITLLGASASDNGFGLDNFDWSINLRFVF